MSAAYSNSPELRLQIADSPLRRRAYLLIIAVALAAPWQAADRGYPLLATALVPMLAWLCWGMRRVPFEGAQLSWRRGEWQLAERGKQRRAEVAPGAVALPWVVLLPLRLAGDRCYLWVFVDSVPRDQWRRLRVRVRLPDPGRGVRW